MTLSRSPADLFPWLPPLNDGTPAQRRHAWEELAAGESLWRGCARAARSANVAALRETLAGVEEWVAAPPPPGDERWLWEARCVAVSRLLTAALIGALAVLGTPPDLLAEWLAWAARDAHPPECECLPSQPLLSASEAIDRAWNLLAGPGGDHELASLRDAALQLLDDNPNDPRRPVVMHSRAPLLLSWNETGSLGWLWGERVAGGSGELLRAPASWLDPVSPDTEAAVGEAWLLAASTSPELPHQDVRWWISGLAPIAPPGGTENGSRPAAAIYGRSLLGAAAALFHCLRAGKPYDASVAVAAELRADGTLAEVGGLAGAAPKLQAAQILAAEYGGATVLISPDNRPDPRAAAAWAARGVTLRVAGKLAEVVQQVADRVPPPLPPAAQRAAPPADVALPGCQRLHLAGVGTAGADSLDSPVGSLIGLLRKRGYLVTTDAPAGSDLPWARRLEAALRQADVLLVLLTAESAGSEVLEYQLQWAADRWQTDRQPRVIPIDTVAGQGRTPLTAAILDPWPAVAWTPGEPVSAVTGELFRRLEDSELPADPRDLSPPTGALPLDAATYIVRDCDGVLIRALERGDSIIRVRGARQMGKTSLLARGLQHVRDRGRTVLFTDFQSLSDRCLGEPDTLYRTLARRALAQLGVTEEPHWDPLLGGAVSFRDVVLEELLGRCAAPVIWAFDEVDRLFGHPHAPEFFGLIRAWHNERATAPGLPWRRLTVVLAYATEVHLYIPDTQSPFNVGTRIPLTDLTVPQVAELNRRYHSPLDERAVERLYQFLGGHPYLTHRALHHLSREKASLPGLEEAALTDEGPFGDHLRRLLLLMARDEPVRLGAYQVLHGGRPSPETTFRLAGAGLIRGEGLNLPVLRCELYERFVEQVQGGSG